MKYKRNITVPVRMSPELRDKIGNVSKLYGMGISEFIRYAVNVVLDTTVYPITDDGK